MTISKQLLEAHLSLAFQKRDELHAQLNAQIGAVNALQELIRIADLPDPKSVAEK